MRITRKIAPLLPDDLVTGGEGNQMREAFQRHDGAVVDILLNRFFEGKYGCQAFYCATACGSNVAA